MHLSHAELLLHPVRMSIVIALAGRSLTARQIASELPDVAQASLYRHLGLLVDGGILAVATERPVRGTVEKTYTLVEHAGRLTPEALNALSSADHLRAFTVFITSLLGDFGRYLNHATTVDPLADGLLYNKGAIYLNADELEQVKGGIRSLLGPLLANPAEGRKRMVFATLMLPTPEVLVPPETTEAPESHSISPQG